MIQIRNKKGFTLIEILINLTLIGILSAFMFANFSTIKKARDTRRKADLKQIEKALEQYRSDNGIYPSNPVNGITDLVNCPVASPTYFGDDVSSDPCSITYLNKIPTDPGGSSTWNSGNYLYYSGDGQKYYLVSCAEDTSDKDALEETDLGTEIETAIDTAAKSVLMNTADFANDCKSDYGYLIISQ